MDEHGMRSASRQNDTCILHHTKAFLSETFVKLSDSKTPSQEERLTVRPSQLDLSFTNLQYSDPDLSELEPQDCVLAKPEDSYILGDSSQTNFGSLALGAVLSYTAVALPDLRKGKSLGDISEWEESWIGSMALLGAAASCPVVGFAIERCGRRRTMLYLTPFFFGGWLIIAFAQNVAMIIVGRFITGFCGGGFSLLTPVYITETSTVNVRGALTSGFDMMLTVGILYIFVLGSYISWRWQAFACGLIPVVFHLLMFFACESPRYLVERGKRALTLKALCWLRGVSSPQQVEPELTQLCESVEESVERAGTWRDLLKMDVLKPTSIGLILMLNQQLSGIDAIMFYTVDIFKSAGTDINENLSTIIVGAIQVVATITSALIVDRCGRRFLLMLSEVFMVLSLGAMGLYFHLKKLNNDIAPESLGWLPLSSLLVYVVAFSIGFGPTPWIIAAEILPPHVKGLAYGLVAITRWILGFLVTIVFQDIIRIFGEDGGYWFFASCCFLGGFYVYFVVPETKGKTLDEIQLYFTSPNVKSINKDSRSGTNSAFVPEDI